MTMDARHDADILFGTTLEITGCGERPTMISTPSEKRGFIGHTVFRSVDDPNNVTVWDDFSTPQSAKDFVSTSRLKEVMGKAGVKGAPQIWFVNQAN
jgi:heme-degrading monooxygenase HmoA